MNTICRHDFRDGDVCSKCDMARPVRTQRKAPSRPRRTPSPRTVYVVDIRGTALRTSGRFSDRTSADLYAARHIAIGFQAEVREIRP